MKKYVTKVSRPLNQGVGNFSNELHSKYLKYGYDEKRAHEKAVSDAEIFFNETQQSSEGAFLSPLQRDNTALPNT